MARIFQINMHASLHVLYQSDSKDSSFFTKSLSFDWQLMIWFYRWLFSPTEWQISLYIYFRNHEACRAVNLNFLFLVVLCERWVGGTWFIIAFICLEWASWLFFFIFLCIKQWKECVMKLLSIKTLNIKH